MSSYAEVLYRLVANPYNEAAAQPLAVGPGGWSLYIDPESFAPYYCRNVSTGGRTLLESSWEKPSEWNDDLAVIPTLAVLASSGGDASKWAVYKDPVHWLQFYVNIRTGQGQWVPPAPVRDQVIDAPEQGAGITWAEADDAEVVEDNGVENDAIGLEVERKGRKGRRSSLGDASTVLVKGRLARLEQGNGQGQALVGDWMVLIDTSTGALYYAHLDGRVQWEVPPEVLEAEQEAWLPLPAMPPTPAAGWGSAWDGDISPDDPPTIVSSIPDDIVTADSSTEESGGQQVGGSEGAEAVRGRAEGEMAVGDKVPTSPSPADDASSTSVVVSGIELGATVSPQDMTESSWPANIARPGTAKAPMRPKVPRLRAAGIAVALTRLTHSFGKPSTEAASAGSDPMTSGQDAVHDAPRAEEAPPSEPITVQALLQRVFQHDPQSAASAKAWYAAPTDMDSWQRGIGLGLGNVNRGIHTARKEEVVHEQPVLEQAGGSAPVQEGEVPSERAEDMALASSGDASGAVPIEDACGDVAVEAEDDAPSAAAVLASLCEATGMNAEEATAAIGGNTASTTKSSMAWATKRVSELAATIVRLEKEAAELEAQASGAVPGLTEEAREKAKARRVTVLRELQGKRSQSEKLRAWLAMQKKKSADAQRKANAAAMAEMLREQEAKLEARRKQIAAQRAKAGKAQAAKDSATAQRRASAAASKEQAAAMAAQLKREQEAAEAAARAKVATRRTSVGGGSAAGPTLNNVASSIAARKSGGRTPTGGI